MGDMNDDNTAYERAKKDAVPGMRMARGLELCTTFNLEEHSFHTETSKN